MENVFFLPWVGSQYQTKGYNGKKNLVLGESHICGGCEQCGDLATSNIGCRNFTTRVINAIIRWQRH